MNKKSSSILVVVMAAPMDLVVGLNLVVGLSCFGASCERGRVSFPTSYKRSSQQVSCCFSRCKSVLFCILLHLLNCS